MKSFSPERLVVAINCIACCCVVSIALILCVSYLTHVVVEQETCSVEDEWAKQENKSWRYLGRRKRHDKDYWKRQLQMHYADPAAPREDSPKRTSLPGYIDHIQAVIDPELKKTIDEILTESHAEEMSSVCVMIVLAPKEQHKEFVAGSDHTKFELAASVEDGDIVLPKRPIPMGQSIEQQARKLSIDIIGEQNVKDIHLFYADSNKNGGIDATVMLFVDQEHEVRGKFNTYRFWIDDAAEAPNDVVLDNKDGFSKPKEPINPKDFRLILYQHLSQSIVISLLHHGVNHFAVPQYITLNEPMLEDGLTKDQVLKRNAGERNVEILIFYHEQDTSIHEGEVQWWLALQTDSSGKGLRAPKATKVHLFGVHELMEESALRVLNNQCFGARSGPEVTKDDLHLFHAKKNPKGGIDAVFILFIDDHRIISGPAGTSYFKRHLPFGIFHPQYHGFFEINLDKSGKLPVRLDTIIHTRTDVDWEIEKREGIKDAHPRKVYTELAILNTLNHDLFITMGRNLHRFALIDPSKLSPSSIGRTEYIFHDDYEKKLYQLPTFIRRVQPFFGEAVRGGRGITTRPVDPDLIDEFEAYRSKGHDADTAHILILYNDGKTEDLEICYHQRDTQDASGAARGKFAGPGGFVDAGESMRDAAWRELDEETMQHLRFGKSNLSKDDLHLFYAYKSRGYWRATFILFINDKDIITGPRPKFKQEMQVEPQYRYLIGTEDNAAHPYHAFAKFKIKGSELIWDYTAAPVRQKFLPKQLVMIEQNLVNAIIKD